MGIGQDEVNVKITGDASDVASAMSEAAQAVRSGASDMGASTARLDKLFEDLESDIKKSTQEIKSAGIGVGAAFVGLEAVLDVVGEAVTKVAEAMIECAKKTFELGSKLNTARQQTDLSGTAISELAYAAQTANVSLETLTTAIVRMERSIAEFSRSGAKSSGVMTQLGISLDEILKLTPDAQFTLIAEAISKIENPAEQARAAVALFGQAGAELLPLFRLGAEGIQEARDRAKDLGLSLDTETITQLNEAKESSERLTTALGKLGRLISIQVAPAFASLADNIRIALGGGSEVEELTRKIEGLKALQGLSKVTEANPYEAEIAALEQQRNELTRAKDVKAFDAQSDAFRTRRAQENAPDLGEVVVSASRSSKKEPKSDEDKLLEGFERLPARMNAIDREINSEFKAASRERMQEFDREAKEVVGKTGKAFFDLKETATNTADQFERDWLKRLAPISAAFNKSITGMIMGTQTLRGAVANIGRSIVAEFVNMSVQSATTWIAQQIRMAVFQRATAKGNVLSNAAEAGAGAYKAIVGIPYVGPFLAPLAAAAAFAGTVAFGARIPSARQGYNVPTGVNPITQLHEDEMVLPAKYADAVRDMAANGTSGGQALNVALSIPAIDGASVKRLVASSEFQRQLRGAFQRAGLSLA